MVTAAEQGMKNTIPLQAKKGRASYLGERSIGHQDPGATSSYLILKALLETLEHDSAEHIAVLDATAQG
jgi:dihydroxyacetone kinase-like protein